MNIITSIFSNLIYYKSELILLTLFNVLSLHDVLHMINVKNVNIYAVTAISSCSILLNIMLTISAIHIPGIIFLITIISVLINICYYFENNSNYRKFVMINIAVVVFAIILCYNDLFNVIYDPENFIGDITILYILALLATASKSGSRFVKRKLCIQNYGILSGEHGGWIDITEIMFLPMLFSICVFSLIWIYIRLNFFGTFG